MGERPAVTDSPVGSDPVLKPVLTVSSVLRSASHDFRRAAIETPDLDARLLLAEALSVGTAAVHSQADCGVPPATAERFSAFCSRRLAGEPVHRIIGRRAFYAHEFHLSPGTLEPRPDTETLVEVAKAEMARVLATRSAMTFADLGVGTGAIVVSLLALFPAATAVGVDISDDALATARRNGEEAGVAARLRLIRSHYCCEIDGPLDLVVSNPPYIPSAHIGNLSREVREHDPVTALDGGADGLDAYRAIASDAHRVLRPAGAVIVEIGVGQAPDVLRIFAERGFAVEGEHRDLGGVLRVLKFRDR